MLYSSLQNNKIKDWKKLKLKKYRDLNNLFLVEGKHLILEAHKAGYLREVLLLEGETLDIDTEINYMTKNIQKELSSLDTPATMIGICKKPRPTDYGTKILILDDIQDPGNLGTIIRSAVAFNIDTIILSSKCADAYSSKVLRASQGMVFHLNIIIADLEASIQKLKNDGIKVFGTKVVQGNELKSIEKMSKFAIIMGNEGNGVKSSLLDLCDEYIYINMNKNCESLNVAVATSIILYELDK